MKEADYVFLFPGNTFSLQFVNCWSQTLVFLNKLGIKAMAKFAYSPVITEVRNMLLSQDIDGNESTDDTKIFGGNLKFKKVVFIDSDIIWTIDNIHRLLLCDKDVVCGVYPLADQFRTSISEEKTGFITVDDFRARPKDSLIELDFGGLGFTACSYDALSSLSYPFFDLVNLPKVIHNTSIEGEDTLFFRKLRQNGFKAYADPAIVVGHMKPVVLTF